MSVTSYTELLLAKMTPVDRVKFERNLDAIYDETTDHLDRPANRNSRRYSVKSLGTGFDWGVWDAREQRYLNPREIAGLGENGCREIGDFGESENE